MNEGIRNSIFIEEEMQKSYLNYSMSMITSRALPDVRDGLKPVHRRVLFGMNELGLEHNKAHKKCARVVGDVIGKYHPHGDAPVYDTLVRMAQDFSLRYTMVDGQGNFGSVDGDPPAAMRYTECRMTHLAEEMMADLDKETVDFSPNYDESMKEPTVMPAKIPFLLVNGSTGIAVGMATNMAPHNLGEVINGVCATIDNPEIEIDDLFKYIPGPDFPTGGLIYGRGGIMLAYRTGRGKVLVRARAEVEKLPGDREQIIITEIPYMVNKTTLLQKMAELARDKAVEGMSFIRDESDRSGMRIVVGIKKDDFGDVVLNKLFKFTDLQTTFGINNLALVNKSPRQLNLKELITYFIEHRHEVVVRRTTFDLNKAKDRAHILEGYRIAVDNIDEIVHIIRASKNDEEVYTQFAEQFGLTEIQSKAILDMQLRRLTGLSREKIEAEYQELLKLIARLEEILGSKDIRMQIIKDELIDIKQRFADERRTEIVDDDNADIDIEDLIADEDMIITMSHQGYIKRTSRNTYRSQHRGGRGLKGMGTRDEDFVETLFVASTHATILFFTNTGRCYSLKVWRIPEAGRDGRGRPIVNILNLKSEEKIAAFVHLREFDDTHFVVMATQNGTINKQPLTAYSNIRKDGLNAINLDDDDRLIECKLTDGNQEIILGTRQGIAVRFSESAFRELGRNTRGVRGIRLRDDDKVVGMAAVVETDSIFTVTDLGYGKQTPVSEYRKTDRGGMGVINMKCTDKTGLVVGLRMLPTEVDMLLVTRNGIIIRSSGDQVRMVGRNTQGVRLINLDEGDTVIDVALCEKEPPEVEIPEDGSEAVAIGNEETVAAVAVDGEEVSNVEGVSSEEATPLTEENPPLE